jgi:UDP-N-acetylmuramoylalanine--D-glutamate ligase
VLGLARSGAATVEALLASGAQVVAWDERETAREALSRHPALAFADPLTLDLTGFAGVVVSPGVPINKHPIAAHARAHGVPLIGDIELFAQARAELPAHKVVGITGTNGKSTTTALVHHILKTAGVPTTMGGNIGLPILAQDPLPEGGVYVLELSSYQIDLTYSLDCDVAVLLNITPDHLDRYDGFEAYQRSKIRLFEMQAPARELEQTDGAKRFAWISADDPVADEWYVKIEQQELLGDRFAYTHPFFAAYLKQEGFHQTRWPALAGPHNAQNAAAAWVATNCLRVDRQVIEEGFETFPGLPHRMERVRERDGVLFVNDSKATNPDSAAPALAAYPDIHWIVGGRAKTDSLGPCEQHLGHVRGAYTIGEAGPMFAGLLSGRVPVTQSQVLEKAVTDAAQAARPGEVVLLSPACASFDQFPDFEARGAMFRAAVEALP